MAEILIVMESSSNRRLLRAMLEGEFTIREGSSEADLEPPFDLAIFDARSLDRHAQWILARREAERPLFLPFLLLASRPDLGYATRQLWKTCDEIILTPVEKIELRARVQILLRARAFSQEMEVRYYTLARSAPIGVFLLKGGNVVWANPYMEDLLRRSVEELAGRPWEEWFHPEDRPQLRQWSQRPGAGDITSGRILQLPTPGGVRWTEVRVTPVGPSEQQGFLGVLADVTGEREIARMKEEFLTTISHELRTPLTSILGFSELLLQQGGSEREYAEHIHGHAEHLAQIVGDLLNLAHLRAGEALPAVMTVFDLRQMVEEVLERFRWQHPGREFVVRSPFDPAQLRGDRDLIAQALRNLLENAVKFSSEGSPVEVGAQVQGGAVRIDVIDHGIGMSPEEESQATALFYRADASMTAVGGFGLGLAVTKSIVDAHSGTLAFESAPGKGTKVTLTLPALAPSKKESSASELL